MVICNPINVLLHNTRLRFYMKKKIKILVLLIIIAAGILAYTHFYAGHKTGPESVRTTGVVEGIETNISSKIPGRVTFIAVRAGDAVRKGELLARMENGDLRAALGQARAALDAEELTLASLRQVIANAEDQVKVERADVASQKAQARRAKAQLALADINLSREKTLYKKGIVAKADLDNAQTNYDSANADAEASGAAIKLAESRLSAAEAALRKSKDDMTTQGARVKQAQDGVKFSQAQLSYSDVYAPSDGVVEYRSVEAGEVVSPGMSIMTIVNPATLWVRIDLGQRFITRVHVGTKARIWLEHHPKEIFNGEVFDIGREGEFAVERDVTRGRQDIKTFRTRIKIDNPKGILKPGMTVLVGIP